MSKRDGSVIWTSVVAEAEDELVPVLRDRGRVGRRVMRWEVVGQRGRVEVGGLLLGVLLPLLLLLELAMLLRLRLPGERARIAPGLVEGLGKVLSDE